MAKAVWNGVTIAESEKTQTVEGNLYFPESSVKREYLRPSSTTSTCPWKGQTRSSGSPLLPEIAVSNGFAAAISAGPAVGGTSSDVHLSL